MKAPGNGLLAALAGLMLAVAPLVAQGAGETPVASPGMPSAPGFRALPSLTVAGHGEVRVPPDQAIVRLGVEVQAAGAKAAQEAANRTVMAVLEAAHRIGVRPEAIQTSELALSPLYAPVPRPQPGETPQAPRVSGYQASNVVSITLEKLDLVGPAIDAGLSAGANRLEGITFGLRHDESARQEALRQAVHEAQQKAAVLAQASRMRLGDLIDLQEEGAAAPQPQMEAMAMRMSKAVAATPVASGEMVVAAGVTLRYRLSPCAATEPCGDAR
jgi:uncharacterized protein YggE